jgi:DMSO/TMAO reductase YedYZ molybdopterin-dependent catalytic subunit
MTYDDVTGHSRYQKVITLHCVEGWDARVLWDGVKVLDLLNSAGIQPGANTVIF